MVAKRIHAIFLKLGVESRPGAMLHAVPLLKNSLPIFLKGTWQFGEIILLAGRFHRQFSCAKIRAFALAHFTAFSFTGCFQMVGGARYEDSSVTAINANGSDDSATDSGAAYVFVRGGSLTLPTWSFRDYLKPFNTGRNGQFGYPVAASGVTLVVGAIGEDSSGTGVNGDGSDNQRVQLRRGLRVRTNGLRNHRATAIEHEPRGWRKP